MTTERHFDLADLFFSTTDLHGKIIFGNRIFAEISGYDFSEMEGRPHSLIRHPDMPRAVFRILWNSIQQGDPIGAFVKNKSKDGGFYWVFAFVVKIDNEYLSVRFKPTGALFNTIQAVYSELRALEKSIETQPGKTKDDAISASLELLSRTLEGLGFSSYAQFAEHAMVEEYIARSKALDRKSLTNQLKKSPVGLNKISNYLAAILEEKNSIEEISNQISSCTSTVAELTGKIQTAALNLVVKSKREQTQGEPLAVVSKWLQVGASGLKLQLTQAFDSIQRDLTQLRKTIFNVTAASLQVEMIELFCEELNFSSTKSLLNGDSKVSSSIALLARNGQNTFQRCMDEFDNLLHGLRRIHETFSELQRDVVGLSLAQVNGLTESCRLSDAEAFGVILHEAMSEIRTARNVLDELAQSLEGISSSLERHLKSKHAISREYSHFASSINSV